MTCEDSSAVRNGFADALAQAMRTSGYSVRRLAADTTARGTPITAPAIRAWLNGESLPTRARTLAALDVIEELLGTGHGMLHRHLQPDRPLVVPGNEAWDQTMAALAEVRRRWDLPFTDPLAVAFQLTSLLHLVPHGNAVRVLMEVQALHDGVERFVLVVDGRSLAPDPTDPHRPMVLHQTNGTLGRTAPLPHGWLALEILPIHALDIEEPLHIILLLQPAVSGLKSAGIRTMTHHPTEILGLQASLDVVDDLSQHVQAWRHCRVGSTQRVADVWEQTSTTQPLPFGVGTLQRFLAETEAAQLEIAWNCQREN